jgi:MarR family transcriptional regulator, temperature-dependent positive regulator of motility
MYDLFETIKRADQAVARMYSRALATSEYDVSWRQYGVLRAATELPGASQKELTYKTGIDRSTMTDIVARLISKGWLARTRNFMDARAYNVDVTEAGQKAFTAAHACYQVALGQVHAHVYRGDIEAILRVLEQLIALAPHKDTSE